MTDLTLLQVIQRAADRLGVARPTSVISSTDQQIRQLFGICLEEGKDLAARGFWQALTREKTFVTVAAETQTNTPIPTDFDRFVPETIWNRTSARQIIGPRSSRAWQADKARPAAALTYLAFRVRDDAFLINPTPTAGETIAYEYITKNWVVSSAGSGKVEPTSDDDLFELDTELMVQGIRWRWKQSKGLDYGEDFETYERNVAIALGEDGGAEDLDIGRNPNVGRVANLPEGSFGL